MRDACKCNALSSHPAHSMKNKEEEIEVAEEEEAEDEDGDEEERIKAIYIVFSVNKRGIQHHVSQSSRLPKTN